MGIASAFMARKGQKEANQQNIDQSTAQMAFQERMSNTAHQRQVADLKAAGLNPILSVNSGASTPTGSAAHIENPDKDTTNNMLSSARLAADVQSMRESIKTQKSVQRLNKASAANQQAQANRLIDGKIGIPGVAEMNMRTFKDKAWKPFKKNVVDPSRRLDEKILGRMGASASFIRKYNKYAYFHSPSIKTDNRKQ